MMESKDIAWFIFGLTLILVAAKSFGFQSWSWTFAFSPFLILGLACLGLIGLLLIIGLISWIVFWIYKLFKHEEY